MLSSIKAACIVNHKIKASKHMEMVRSHGKIDIFPVENRIDAQKAEANVQFVYLEYMCLFGIIETIVAMVLTFIA